MGNNSFKEIIKKIKGAKKILLTLHTAPDGDSLGSCTAMKYVLERNFNCQVTLVSPDPIGEALQSLKIAGEVNFGKDILDFNLKEFDLLIALDCATPEMLGKIKKDFSFLKDIFVINIDHHQTNEYYGNLNYVDTSAPALGSILLDLFKEENIELDEELAKRLVLGIYTDTNCLRIQQNISRAFKDVSFLLENGADFYRDILEPITLNKPLKIKRYIALLIDNLKINKEKKFAYSVLSRKQIEELKLNVAEVRIGINELYDIQDIDFVFTLAETEDYIKGSFRSKGDIDVSVFCQKLGGGGHKNAGAFRLSNLSLKEAEKKVLEIIEACKS
jgi:phosphoesterase RecJ-like protein